ncbi:hypothetical protein FEM03_08175 [Phragmitibacter flavus]|uniref:LamG domain-containing protein n=1 Tax=Phragmitibacter flavus TaxID=2576071 RepID=A0A5R8KGX7_9BACT|nr:hypothetical protein [Phragmitibacter flavus]TLD71491.1 hypothetical protein FEM03_08175 [Phragmitibacter flavus]
MYGKPLTDAEIQKITRDMAKRWDVSIAAPDEPDCSTSVPVCLAGLNPACSDGSAVSCSSGESVCPAGQVAECTACAASNICPSGVSGCTHWFDAQAGSSLRGDISANYPQVSSGGDKINLWCDKASGNHATAMGSPVLRTSVINSYNAIETVDAVSSFIAQGKTTNTDFTVIAVANFDLGTSTVVGSYQKLGLGNHNRVLRTDVGTGTCYSTCSAPELCSFGHQTVPTDTNHIMSFSFNESTKKRMSVVNGKKLIDSVAMSHVPDADYRMSGIMLGETFTGFVGEVAIYNRTLSESEAAEIECGMATRWGLCASMLSGYCTGTSNPACGSASYTCP